MKTSILNSIRVRPFVVLLLFSLFSGPTLLFAQKDTTKKLKEVSISSSAAPKVQTVTPSQQINASDFDRYGAFNVADAIRDFSGINIKDYGGIGGLKTVSVRSLGANHLAVLYDGVELNDAENGQVDLGKLNLNNVQEITLYNGQPANLLQPAASFASASVLSIKTIHPQLTADKPFQITAGIKGGSFGLINPYLQWQQRLGNEWSFIVNSYWEKANGQYKFKVNGDGSDTLATRHNADVNAQQADGALYWTKNDSNKFQLHVNYYNSDRGVPGAVIFYNPYSSQRLYDQDYFVQGEYQRAWVNGLQLLLNTKLASSGTRYIDPEILNSYGGTDERYTEKDYYQSLALAYNLTGAWKIAFSTDAVIANLNTTSKIPNLVFVRPTRFSLLNVLSSSYVLGKWKFEGNLLHTYINNYVQSGSAQPNVAVWSPTIMATFRPFAVPGFQLRAFYKDIFRNPTFGEEYYNIVGTHNVKPEYAKQFDLGATYVKNLNGVFNYVTLTMDTYYNKVSNKIIALPNNTPFPSIINLGKVDIEGIDAGLKTQAKLTDSCKAVLGVNYTYQYAVDVTDPAASDYRNQIPYTPKNTVALNTGIKYKHIGVYYNQVISSSRYYLSESAPSYDVPGYGVSDASVVYNHLLAGKLLVLSLEVSNLFNEEYAIVRSYPMPGRSYRLSVQITI